MSSVRSDAHSSCLLSIFFPFLWLSCSFSFALPNALLGFHRVFFLFFFVNYLFLCRLIRIREHLCVSEVVGMNDDLRRVVSLLPRDAFSLPEVLRLCHSCKGMHALLTLNHGPVLVDVSLDVQQMCDMSLLGPCRFNRREETYDITIDTTRELMSSLFRFDMRYKIHSLCLDFCHQGYQANLSSVTTGKREGPPSLHEYFIFSAFQNLRYLQSLHIYNVNLNAELVANYLSTFTGQELSLVQCGMQMGDAFLRALGLVDTLRVLCLSGNSFVTPVSSVSAFASNLHVLNCNDCVSADMRVLCGARVHRTLTALHWNDNYLPDDQKTMLYGWLRTCPTLHTLLLRNTSLVNTDAHPLLAALDCLPLLTSLDVASNELQDAVLAFADVMPRLQAFYVSARRCHHVALGTAWGKTGVRPGRTFVMYEELEEEDLEVDA
jgi:hypothetical protein